MADYQPLLETSAEHLRLVMETGQIGIWELDLSDGGAWRNAHHDAIFGYPHLRRSWSYDDFLAHVVDEDRDRVARAQEAAIAERREWVFDCRIRRADGEIRWVSAAGRPLLGDDGEVAKLIGHVIDITEVKRNETRLRLVSDELNHRVRNMLAMVGSMVRLSRRQASDIDSFAAGIAGRIEALARTQNLLIAENTVILPVGELIAAELSAYPGLVERTRVSGADGIVLRGATAQGLALILHELITNALKYGAFSGERGEVAIHLEGVAGDWAMDWRERGGPEVTAPAKDGFGTRLIAGALGGAGSARIDYDPEGLHCRIAVSEKVELI